jgi:NAD(P)-dependent dehydrogenase (short-subunit alcohol dehydrogenase family)
VARVESADGDHIQMKRFGRPAEVAVGVAFLCSERVSFMTGETIALDRGRTWALP